MYKKSILLGLASALLLFSIFGILFVMPVVADPKIIRVPENYLTIQAAVDAANPGDTIQVASGTYYENVKIGKSVKLVGEGNETTIIDGNGTDTVVYVTAQNVDISGFTIRNGMIQCKGAYFPGIYFYQSSGSTVSRSVLSNNFVGISIYRSNNILVNGNVVTDNQKGIELAFSNDNTIVNNTVILNWLYGIRVFVSDRNTIAGNNVSYNQRTTFTYGIYLEQYSDANIVYHNNFINNAIQAYENQTNTWDNGADGNYWSDYTGQDLNGDGIGDTLLPHLGLDYYPLMEPWPHPPPPPPPAYGPVAVFTYSPLAPLTSEVVAFNASASLPGFNGTHDMPIVSYAWDFGDGTPIVTEADPITTHNYTLGGNYNVVLNVTDSQGFWNTTSKTITVTQPPSPIRVYYYNVTWNGVTYCVAILTNSTVESFDFSELLAQVSFNVTIPPGSVGFCNVTIPIDLLNDFLMVRIDGSPIEYILSRNATHSFLYFNFSQGTHRVEIFDGLDVMNKSWFKMVGDLGYDERADLNGDGFVNIFDLVILGKYLHKV